MFQKTTDVQHLLDAKLQLTTELADLRVSALASRFAEDIIRAKNNVINELVEELRKVGVGTCGG